MASSCNPSLLMGLIGCIEGCLSFDDLSTLETWLTADYADLTLDSAGLVSSSKCIESCVNSGNANAVVVWLLTRIAGVSSDPSAVASKANCMVSCLTPEQVKSINVMALMKLFGFSSFNMTTIRIILFQPSVKCFRACLLEASKIAIKIYALAVKAGVPVSSDYLVENSKCFACLNPEQLELMESCLWCQIANV